MNVEYKNKSKIEKDISRGSEMIDQNWSGDDEHITKGTVRNSGDILEQTSSITENYEYTDKLKRRITKNAVIDKVQVFDFKDDIKNTKSSRYITTNENRSSTGQTNIMENKSKKRTFSKHFKNLEITEKDQDKYDFRSGNENSQSIDSKWATDSLIIRYLKVNSIPIVTTFTCIFILSLTYIFILMKTIRRKREYQKG